MEQATMPAGIRPRLAAAVAGTLAATLMLTGCSDDSAEQGAMPATTATPTASTPTPTPSPSPTPRPDPWAKRRTYTIMFLGGDGGPNRRGVRTDSVIVAVVNTKTGNTTLIGVPRNLQRVRFRPGTPMRERFPAGFPDFLFGIYTYGQAHPGVMPRSKHPGADLLKDTMSYNLGLHIDNYVLANMAGFQRLINALDGVQMRVLSRIPIGGQKTRDGTRILRYPHDYLEPGLYRHMTGRQTLWFSRSRFGSTDYARMARQRCVLGGLVRQLDLRAAMGVFRRNTPPRGGALHTDIRMSRLRDLATLANRVRSAEITGITLGPPLINGADPNWSRIRSRVQAAIARTRQAHRDRTRARAAARSGELQSLDSVCRYR